MLNKNNERELAYVVQIDDVLPHNNADRLEIAVVNGWRVIVGKGEFKPGDPAIYFEIDSKLPEREPWTNMEFLSSKHFKIKTQKLRGEISQGFLAHPNYLGWEIQADGSIWNPAAGDHGRYDVGDFLTEELGVTYSVAEDNNRKKSLDKYKAMAQRNVKLAKTNWWRWLYKRTWGKKLLFFLFGKKTDKKKDWPAWVVKSDEERIENTPWILNEHCATGEKFTWIATEKVDGTSCTFTMKRGKFGKKEFYVCSRNVVFDTPEKMDRCYYDQNYYVQMAERNNAKELLQTILDNNPSWDWVTIQGEIYGSGIQKNNYGMSDVDFRAFNLVDSEHGRWNSEDAKDFLEKCSAIKWVPILEKLTLPDTVEELREYVHSEKSTLFDGMKEGVVFRSLDGQKSFKCVDPEYLIKYHS